ncbi:hypothetical protein SARC_10942 [Sphaeroforma arctica JP610]|uniref:Enoyl reductase (ER) domain-containing protein n=1 Tax=Sphaeroforma arctica JP610 TaxID=667725 RepID=A0A0L0FKN8_9EUKA|nr:hypothetical protein SARC_10942 [Sphaeroforma arctica JP610]KNC76563.1 hypothetical protein SARC_10942 [Sphaeroforma arctica JP610]|eukprot:XP_014150465.1 hypothetical protein SARC_10942 [Sphaeroforma arctica JP610]
MSKNYQACVVHEFGGPEKLLVEEVTTPTAGDGQVLVTVKAAGVNPVDTYIRQGTYARKPTLPYTPGADAAGVVLATGKGVTHVVVGDRVYLSGSITGTYAHAALCNEVDVHALPEAATFEQGAAINVPFSTAHRALFLRAEAKSSDTLLVHGASGGVGIGAVQMGKAHGMTVVGTAGSEDGCKAVLEAGADACFNHRDTDYLDKLKAHTPGGFNVILEMLANANLCNDLKMIARHGKVVVIGNRGTIEFDPRLTMATESCVMGCALGQSTPEDKKEAHAYIQAGLANETLKPKVGRSFALKDVQEAHKYVIEQSGSSNGKVVINMKL